MGKIPVVGTRPFRAPAVAFAMVAVMLFAVFGSGASASGEEGETRDEVQDEAVPLAEDQAPAIPEKRAQRYPNLGSHLNQQVIQVEQEGAFAREAAEGAAMSHGGTVAVTIHLSGNVDEVVKLLEDSGGDPRNVGSDYIEAYVPVTLLGRVSQMAGVLRVREIVAAQPDQSPPGVVGHGRAAHGSAPWNQAGYAGQGVKVGIIDSGFRGMSSLMGTDLPATVVARCYTGVGEFTQDLADCEAVGNATAGLPFPECREDVQRRRVLGAAHGTIVAEAVIDIAPEVSLYVANPRSWADLQDAVEWMASEGVTVINQSLSWFLDGPGDGTSPSSTSPLRTVDLAVARDITWVNSAGNGARNTWFGGYADPDGNRVISFAGGVNDEVLGIPVRACRRYTVQLRWEDTWDGASSDLDLYLYDRRSGRLIPTISSRDEQSGAPGHRPFEWLSFWSRTDSDDLGLVVFRDGGDAPDWIQLIVWGAASIERYTRSGSIGNPAESANPGLLAVGAAHWDDVFVVEPYSSRGPTPDGRIKPDVVGADCGVAALEPLDEYTQGFCGTSQASPHVAGMAALVRQRFPGYTAVQVAGYLKDIAQQRQSPDPNNTWGHGFVKLPPPDGSATTPPAPSGFVRSPAADFDTLAAAGNIWPQGIWSDGTTIWVADLVGEKIYAYDMETKARAPGGDFDTLAAAGNTWPQGIWSDGTTMWVADLVGERIYAYDMETKARVPGKDFDTRVGAGNTRPQGIWSDGATMWVADLDDEKLFAYDMETGERVSGKDYDTLRAARNRSPRGIWSDGTTMWVADSGRGKIYAYDMATRSRVSGRELNALEAAGNTWPRGIWSDGTTMWVADPLAQDIYAYSVGSTNQPPAFAEATTERTVAENTAAGTDIGDPVEATDPEDDTLTYRLGGADASFFDIVPGVGQLMTKAALDHEIKASYAVTVTAEDPSGLSDSVDVTITVTDVNEAPDLSGNAAVSYAENGTDPVGTYTAADPEGETLNWSLSGDDEGDFAIAGGVLAFAAAPDYEAPADADTDNVYEVTVTATDPDGLTAAIDVTITVTDVNEAPDLSGNAANAAVDYAENGSGAVATYTATDPEGDTLAWRLSGADAGDFSISSAGVLTFRAAPDYENPADADTDNVYAVTVIAEDPDGLTDSLNVTVTVTDVDETSGQTLLERYDADNSGAIERAEVIAAINDFLDGNLSRADVIAVINLYFGN